MQHHQSQILAESSEQCEAQVLQQQRHPSLGVRVNLQVIIFQRTLPQREQPVTPTRAGSIRVAPEPSCSSTSITRPTPSSRQLRDRERQIWLTPSPCGECSSAVATAIDSVEVALSAATATLLFRNIVGLECDRCHSGGDRNKGTRETDDGGERSRP